jgi:2-succinyl-5-enolpyruvyl-6-hydroxy-3-cyclohexene-1-carboxylate synthase
MTAADITAPTLSHVERMFMSAKRPMLICGQPMNPGFDEAVALVGNDDSYVPDFVLCTGGSIVSKRLKRFLRKAHEVWMVNETGEVTDTFMNLTQVIQGDGKLVADHVQHLLEDHPHPFVMMWEELLRRVRSHAESYEPAYSQMAVVKAFESRISGVEVHYANSTAIRLANIYAQHPVWCNRGVNGIEGSLSTAAGFSCVTDEQVFCIIGDLSFFYDQNALWNQNLQGNLRILLLNNGKGGIFNMLKGLEQSGARDRFVAAEHHTSAEGICLQNNVRYLKAENMGEMLKGVDTLLNMESSRPVLLEVFTDASEDERVFKDYYKTLR